MSLAQYESILLEICKEASSAILKVYQRPEGFSSKEKADKSPVTEADELSDALITQELLRQTPFPVVSEERVASHSERLSYKQYWIVDPLDGTKDFLAKDDEFTINIALIQGDESVLGMVYLPALALAYCAGRGEGSYRIGASGRHRMACSPPRPSLRAAVSRFHDSDENEKFCRASGVTEKFPLGSSLKFGKLAEGEIDIYPRLSGSMEWDVAAGQIIVEEAGGKLIDVVTKKPMRYSKPTLVSNYFVAGSRELDIETLLRNYGI